MSNVVFPCSAHSIESQLWCHNCIRHSDQFPSYGRSNGSFPHIENPMLRALALAVPLPVQKKDDHVCLIQVVFSNLVQFFSPTSKISKIWATIPSVRGCIHKKSTLAIVQTKKVPCGFFLNPSPGERKLTPMGADILLPLLIFPQRQCHQNRPPWHQGCDIPTCCTWF